MIQDALRTALANALAAAGLPVPGSGIVLDPPKRREHGDWTTPVALASAKNSGRPPRAIAEELQGHLEAAHVAHLERIEIAGPGHLNFFLSPSWLHDVLRTVVDDGERYGTSDGPPRPARQPRVRVGQPDRAAARGRRPVGRVGDAIANLLAAQGAEVHREYYLNDAGTQLGKFRDSLDARYRGVDAARGRLSGPVPRRHGDAAAGRARRRRRRRGGMRVGIPRDRRRPAGRPRRGSACTSTRGSPSERCTTAATSSGCCADLDARGVTYEADGAKWLRATDFGDQRDRVLVRSDGTTTYLCNDLAYHRDKFDRGFTHLIDIWGADHHGQVKSLQAGMEALGYPPGEPEIMLGQFVKLVQDGEEVRHVEAHRQHHHARRHPRRGRPRRRAHDVPAPGHRLAADVRPRRRHRAVDGEPRLLRAVRARADRVDRSARRRSGRDATRVGIGRPLAASRTSAKRSSCARSRCIPTSSRRRPTRARRRRCRTWVRDFARAFHGFYRDCRVLTDDDELTQARLWLTEACRIGLANALATPRCARARGDEPARRRRRDDDDETTSASDAPFDLSLLPASATVDAGGRVAIGGVDLVELGGAVRHAAVRVRRGRAARPVPRVPRRLRRGRRVREQGVPLHRDGAAGRRGRPFDSTSRPAASCSWRCTPVSRPSASCSTATTSRPTSCSSALDAGVGRIVVDSFDELDRLESLAAGRRSRAGAARPGDAGCRSAHARVHRDRHRRLEVRLRPRQWRRAAKPSARIVDDERLRVRGRPLPHRFAGVPRSTRSRGAIEKMVGLVAAIEARPARRSTK